MKENKGSLNGGDACRLRLVGEALMSFVHLVLLSTCCWNAGSSPLELSLDR
jgi:hypothetical protein